MRLGECPCQAAGGKADLSVKTIPKNVGNCYVMKDIDIYYLHLIMDCQWRCAGSEANINPGWHYFVCLFVYFLEHFLLVSELYLSVQQTYEGRQKHEGGREGGTP